jgi:GTPase SAR1 family protein
MNQYKVSVMGSRRVGKTALVHFMTNTSKFGTQYQPTNELDKRHIRVTHPDENIGVCSVALEDTPGWKSGRRATESPDLLEPKIAYVWCDDGVRKPGAEDPDAQVDPADEKTPLVTNELKGVSPIDSDLDRQGFIVVYNPLDRDSFNEAQNLLQDIQEKMAKPEAEDDEKEQENKDEEEEVPELPPYPFVVVATHADMKKDKRYKNIVDPEMGRDLANSFGGQFFEVNGNGKNVHKALEAVISAINTVENNLKFDKEPTKWEKCCQSCKSCGSCMCKCITLNYCFGCCSSGCSVM